MSSVLSFSSCFSYLFFSTYTGLEMGIGAGRYRPVRSIAAVSNNNAYVVKFIALLHNNYFLIFFVFLSLTLFSLGPSYDSGASA
jgi:hypothetical protein